MTSSCGGCGLFVLTVRALLGRPTWGRSPALTQSAAVSQSRAVITSSKTQHAPHTHTQSRSVVTSSKTCSLEPLSPTQRKSPGATGKKGERTSPSSRSSQRNLSAAAAVAVAMKEQYRPQPARGAVGRHSSSALDLGDVVENTRRALACKSLRRFLVEPALARLVTEHLADDIRHSNALILECDPGPGLLTRALLNCGAQRLVALEGDKTFLPDLQALERRVCVPGQLEVLHCDFAKLDPIRQGNMRPPAMYSEKLFTHLGVEEADWTADVPVRVVGMFSLKSERNLLLKLVYSLFERLSVFRYGRIELIVFITEREYTRLVAKPGNFRAYQPVGALWQMACNIQLLHKEPASSFVTTSKDGRLAIPKNALPDDNMCLVRLTPREDFFTSRLTPHNGGTLVMMVKQCLAKRRALLVERLDSWSADSGSVLVREMGLFEDVLTGQLYPEEYKQLFSLMEQSQQFKQSWLYEEILENTKVSC
ncbi:dimethyladenosine transferase 2, mitochondrial [Engraulis encrasicolus]|uniref:dimethyladenosine transferase 2, mitochondrial n=1 Tax=Engraulis encrasicolus TaxID=184585 RepID=UPI002FD17517